MPQYRYRAKRGPTELIDGIIEAQGKDDAIEKINGLGLVPVQVAENSARAGSPEQLRTALPGPGSASTREITVFSGQLASLIKSGVTILKAMGIIIEQTDNRYFRQVLVNVSEEIKVGGTFSETLARYPRVFSPLYVAIVKAGEDTGTLHQALERITQHLRAQEGVISRVRIALIYPGLMTAVGIATVAFMLVFVIPKIQGIFAASGQELPLPTQILITASRILRAGWFGALCVVAAGVIAYKKFARTHRAAVSSFVLRIPVYGAFVRKVEISRVARTLELSLRSGITIVRALELAIPIIDNEIIKRELAMAGEQIKQGESLGRNLKKTDTFPPFMTNFIIIGEESGKLQEVFAEIADYFERDTDEALRILTAQLEPVMILLIGSVLGYIVIAMLLPIFQINLLVQ